MLKRAIEAAESGEAFDIEHEDDPTMRRNIRSEIDLYFPEGYIDDDEKDCAAIADLPNSATYPRSPILRWNWRIDSVLCRRMPRWLMMYFKVDILAKQHELKGLAR